jgi:DNA-binding MarR family transcriptional regulator
MEPDHGLHKPSAVLVLDIAKGWATLTGYPDCPIHFLGVFAALAAHGGDMPMQDVARITARSGSSITRAVVKLGAGSFRSAGYGWVEAYEDPQWRRRKLVRLTDEGRRVADRLIATVATGLSRMGGSVGDGTAEERPIEGFPA